MMIVSEIGLNHLGDENYANQYLDKIIKSKCDAVTFQIKDEKFYIEKKHSNLVLSDKFYVKAIRKIKKSELKFGIAIADIKKVDFFDKLNVDFYKVLSPDINNYKLISRLILTGKKIFVSTGFADNDKIKKFADFVKDCKSQFSLIHTHLSHDISDTNLKAIYSLKEQFKMPVAYGNHTTNFNVLFVALGFEPEALFFYVKGNRHVIHPDEKHSIRLLELSFLINNLRILRFALGTGMKIGIDDKTIKIKDGVIFRQ